MLALTQKQSKTLNYIKGYKDKFGVAPSYSEIADNFGINVNAIKQVIDALIKKGYLEKTEGVARSLRITETEEEKEMSKLRDNITFIPLYGKVAAGEPIFADDNIEGYIPLKKTRRMSGNIFSVTVSGDSMVNKHIIEKDILIVRKQNYANDGDIVVALLDDEVTVKIFKQKGRETYLQPANPDYKPIYKPFKILGLYIGIVRDLDIVYE